MKICLLTFMILLSARTAFAQDYTVSSITEKNPNFPDDVYTFPILGGGNKEIAQKINSYLVKEQLDIEYGRQKKSIFENVWQNDTVLTPVVSDLKYKVELLNKKWYSVTLSGEGCGAYCEGFDNTYNFDLRTGTLLMLDTLFTRQGQKELVDTLVQYKKKTIQEKVDEIKAILNLDTMSAESRQDYEEMVDMYTNCVMETAEDLPYLRYIPEKDSLKIIYGRCSAHYNMAIDELWYFEKEIPIAEWMDRLSPLGKEILKN
jgi:hypothetical protein